MQALQAHERIANLSEKLGTLGRSDEFARSLCEQFLRRKSLSEKQWQWVDKLSQDKPAPAASVTLGNVSGMIDLFDRAAKHLKFPKIRLSVDDRRVVISRAGARSKAPGTLNVTDGGPYGDNVWYGRVRLDGTFEPSSQSNDSIASLLVEFALNPAKVASDYGKLTGNCCFCSRHLEDERSTQVGYGPVCADHYGLPWGA